MTDSTTASTPNASEATAAPGTAAARERAHALLDPARAAGTLVHGFAVESAETIDELDADAYVLRHAASGARLLYLACEDENKAFAIGFKTPPVDDTGVFHILEHSVLCGSAKYPVKEPFVDLIKSSMQTFLNAMTYPDKTVYPVASTNEQDLLNLMDVYMDAVLNPAIYTKPTIFEQEGWHYELDGEPGGAGQTDGIDGAEGTGNAGTDERLRYNGVVFNEMKGALSDPISVLDDAVNRALFPDTAYARESGGDPRHIPELTYAHFLDTHARHYNLANSYITLYGDLDADRVLARLDERYLADGPRERDAAARRAAAPDTAAFDAAVTAGPNPLAHQNPVVVDYDRVEMVTTPDNALVGLGYVLGEAADRKRVLAADVLFDALLGSNEAPVKKAILAAGLGGDVSSYTSTACLQPYEFIILQNAKPGVARRLREVVQGTARELVEHGVPRERLEAVISSNEYSLRQRDYGTADGVVLACNALSTWLYDDANATLALKQADIYAELRRDLDGSYFEDLLRELVLESDHAALVELVAVDAADAPEDGEAAELAEKLAGMDDAARQAIRDDVARLRELQEAEDTPEAKATLPRLHVADIGPARPEPALTVDTTAPLPCLKHDIPTHRLAYAFTYFDLTHVSFAELPYIAVLSLLMQQLPTREHTAAELDSYIGSNLGFLSFTPQVYTQPNWKLARPMLCVAAGALSEKIDKLAAIPREVWADTLFEDTGRIRDVLTQQRISMEQGFLNAGHSAAMERARSYVTPAAVASQQLSGVDFYRFLRTLLEHFDERVDELLDRLRDLQARIFTSTGAVASFTGSDEDYARYWAAAGGLGLSPRTAKAKELMVPWPEPKSEAFVIPSDVCYVARATDPRALGLKLNGAWSVAANALTFDYLWNEVRVKGGAYGCGFRASINGRNAAFYTYRDPGVDASLARIARAGSWLSGFEPDEQAFEGFIVSCVSGMDAPVKPYGLATRQDAEYFSQAPAGWRTEVRDQMLACTPEQLRALGADVERVAEQAPLCVFGGREILEHSNEDLQVIDLLG